MSWTALQTTWRAPSHGGGKAIAGPMYINGDSISYLYDGNRKISAKTHIGYSIKVGGLQSDPNWISCCGYTGFTGGGYNVWKDPNYGWVASPLPLGTALLEYFNPTDPTVSLTVGSYVGDDFYTLGTAGGSGYFPALGASITAYGRGALRGSTYGGTSSNTLAITTQWDRWEPETAGKLGKFLPQGDASGDKYFGLPQWKNVSETYTRSLAVDVNSKYSYGSISWNATASKYILGTYGSTAGWNEASDAPTSGSDWTLSFAKPDGSKVTGSNVTLSWDQYVLGTNTADIFVFRACKWGDAE